MNQHARRIIRVTPTITGVTYANNDILFDTTEIPLAVGKKGECSKLVSAMIISNTPLIDFISPSSSCVILSASAFPVRPFWYSSLYIIIVLSSGSTAAHKQQLSEAYP